MNKLKDQLTLECSYTPHNFFEEPFEHTNEHYSIRIENGRVLAAISGVFGSGDKILFDDIYAEIGAYFLGAQLCRSESYELSGYATKLSRADGSIEVSISAELSGHSSVQCHLVGTDSAGNVIVNSHKDRIESQIQAAHRASKFRTDAIVSQLLSSYRNAIASPKDELTHLYEIRDALVKIFGGDRHARLALGIKRRDWSRFGQLANGAPLSQGRHRGNQIGTLRDATMEELKQARGIASAMIHAYQDYLDRNSKSGSGN